MEIKRKRLLKTKQKHVPFRRKLSKSINSNRIGVQAVCFSSFEQSSAQQVDVNLMAWIFAYDYNTLVGDFNAMTTIFGYLLYHTSRRSTFSLLCILDNPHAVLVFILSRLIVFSVFMCLNIFIIAVL